MLLCVCVAAQQQQQQQRPVVVDKMVALVNGSELITQSDLVWQMALQPDVPLETLVNPRSEDLQRALQRMIEQALIFQEAEKLPTIAPDDKEVRDALAAFIKTSFPSQTAFYERVARVGLSSEKLTEIIRRRVAIDKYLSFRFRTFAVVTDVELTDYYNNVYAPRQRRLAPGSIVPALDEKRAELTELLKETKTSAELESFLEEAARRAEIVILNQV